MPVKSMMNFEHLPFHSAHPVPKSGPNCTTTEIGLLTLAIAVSTGGNGLRGTVHGAIAGHVSLQKEDSIWDFLRSLAEARRTS